MSAGFAGCVVSVVFCGYFSDKVGRKAALVGAAALFGVGLTGIGSGRTEMLLLCAAPLAGAGSACMQAVAAALITDLFPTRRSLALNACQIAFGAGAVVGPGTVYMLLEAGTTWRTVYTGIGWIAFALALLIGANRTVPRSQANGHLTWKTVVSALRTPAFAGLCLAQVFYAGAEVGFFEWMPAYFKQSVAGGTIWVGRVVSIFWLAMTFGRLAMSALLGRFKPLTIGIWLAALGAVASAAALAGSHAGPAILGVAFTGLLFGGIYSTILAETGDRFHAGSALGTALGGISASGNIGSAMVPWAVGAIAAQSGNWRSGLCLVPISALSAGALMAFVQTRRAE
jgi:FHS family glucose/mannose:H+ symporter-like MFS transporter